MLAAASIRIAIAGIETRLLEIAIKMPVAATVRFCETKPTPIATTKPGSIASILTRLR